MSKKGRRVPYEESYLEEISKEFSKNEESENVFDELLITINCGLCNSLELHEKRWFFHIASGNYEIFKNSSKYSIDLKPLLELACFDDFKFRQVFSDYYNDLDGYKINSKFKVDYEKTLQTYDSNLGTFELVVKATPISVFEKEADILYLNAKFEEWSSIINNHKDAGDILLNRLIHYTNTFKNEFIENRGMGYFWIKTHKRILLLRSKYMYISGKQIFKDSKYFEINIGQNRIEYNYESHCHVAVKHFSLGVGINDKSHFYKDFDLTNIINLLPKIFSIANNLHIFNESIIASKDAKSFFFEYNSQVYALWVCEGKGRQVRFIEVTSFYPTEGNKHIEIYSKLTKSNPVILEGKSLAFFH
ncbi:hypothetical protein VB796_09155 [Arcicella sp. LKC2W]|uniref:hypothetical protein n=1 Tax=Arcicella sp. LKC2W TaxID=2984198 RepID=UPI002B207239|nr:hypothetical protein [Arcicella sp. LKC2W]MEA5459204.1 hypothetical protein [Arcicella sp. LKC2W]